MKPRREREIRDAKGGKSKRLPCLTKSKCGRVRPRARPRQMPTVKRDLFTSCKKVAEKIAPFPRRTPAVKGRITSSVNRTRIIMWLYHRGPLIRLDSRYEYDRTRARVGSLPLLPPHALAVSRAHRLMKKTYWHGNTADRQIKRSSTPPPCDL